VAGPAAFPLAALWEAAQPLLPETYRGPLTRAQQWAPRVWRLELHGGGVIALKVSAPGQSVLHEGAILRWLGRHECPTPRVLATGGSDPEWLATTWSGDATLDSLPSRADGWGEALAGAVLDVEHALQGLLKGPQEHEVQATALIEQARPWAEAAPGGVSWLLGRPLVSKETRLLQEVIAQALGCRPALGSLDYTSRNVVVGAERLHLVDFPSVGYDWTERRLAQYAMATRSGFATVLTRDAVAAFAERAAQLRGGNAEVVAQGVDAHALLLVLTAATQLQLVERGEAHPERARAWGDVAARKEQLREMLGQRLTAGGPTYGLRNLLSSSA
jgi:hypothetical protein